MIIRRSLLLVTVALAVILHALLWLPLPLIMQTIAALLLTGFLPGTLLVEWLIGHGAAPPDLWERILYSSAAGYGVMTLVLLGLSYLPGGVVAWQVYLAVDLLLVILLSFLRWGVGTSKCTSPPTPLSKVERGSIFLPSPPWRGVGGEVLGLLILLLVAGFLRFTNLGYAEFQGDEGRAVLRAAAVIQGYEDALFLHRKGPVEILLPTLVYALTGHLTEATARLPFALANLAGVVAIFVLGWRLFNPLAGWVAALFLALDGYFIGFARIVQYQSIVILTSVLVVLILYRLVQNPAGLRRYLLLAAFLLATGVLAHYEAALVVVPGLYLLWQLWQRHKPPQFVLALGLALSVAGITAATFYVPYLLNPAFQNTYAYLTDERIGGQFPYNNLTDFFLRTTLYDTTYAVLLLITLTTLAILRLYWRAFAPPWRWLLGGLTLVGLVLTFVKADWLTIGGIDYTFVFFLVLFAIAWWPHRPTLAAETGEYVSRAGEHTLWLWFGALLVLSLFFVGKPRTHVYVFFMPWVLISGMVVADMWRALRTHWGASQARIVGGLAATALIALFGSYAYWYFVYNQVEIYRTWTVNHPAGFWTLYDQPDDRSLFGFPLRNGWKTVGMLYSDGVLKGAYETNDVDDWVTDWYVHGVNRCLRDHQYYILADSLERKNQARKLDLMKKLEQEYHLLGTILVHDQPRLQIYERGGTATQPQTFASEIYAPRFDAALSGPQFALGTPVIEPAIAHPLQVRLGDTIWLEGYQIDRTVVAPGDVLNLTLYWRATARIDEKQTVFNQVLGPDQRIIGQLDGQPGCEAMPTDDWPVGELLTDRYQIPIAPDAAAGEYKLVTGMYNTKHGDRLVMTSPNGSVADNAFDLTPITVQAR